jgi:hypothetical protein
MFFLERKNQRTFATAPTLERTAPSVRGTMCKSFCFFFSKKQRFLSYA